MFDIIFVLIFVHFILDNTGWIVLTWAWQQENGDSQAELYSAGPPSKNQSGYSNKCYLPEVGMHTYTCHGVCHGVSDKLLRYGQSSL